MKNNYIRKLGDNELAYVKFSKFYGQFVCPVLECEKGIDISILNEGLAKLKNLLPELNLIVDENHFTNSQYILKVQEIEVDEFNGFNFEVLPFSSSPADLAIPINVYKISARAKDYLIFRIHHSLMDGQGALIFIGLLFDIINNRDITLPNTFESDREFVSSLKIFKKPLGLKFNNIPLKRCNYKDSKLIIKRIKIKGTTNGILPKVITIIKKYYKNEKLTFLIPSSIRRYAPEKINVGNLTLPLYLNVQKNDTWDFTYKDLYKEIKSGNILNLNNINYGVSLKLPNFIFYIVIKLIVLFQRFSNSYLTAGKITNLGIVDINKFSAKTIQILSVFEIPLYNPFFPLAISIIENINFIEVVISADKRAFSSELIESMAKDIQELKA